MYDLLSVQRTVPYSLARIRLDPDEEKGPSPATPPYFLLHLAPGSASFEDSEPRSRHCQRPGHAVCYRQASTRTILPCSYYSNYSSAPQIIVELQQWSEIGVRQHLKQSFQAFEYPNFFVSVATGAYRRQEQHAFSTQLCFCRFEARLLAVSLCTFSRTSTGIGRIVGLRNDRALSGGWV